ncbi:MAG: toll/interleukin-1 receptor domain-containing protein [Thiolinea sp.]
MIFISYSGSDRAIASKVGSSLETANINVWWDAYLLPNEPFEQQIQRILALTNIVLAILSPQTLASEWVRWELSQASQNGIYILPILINGARPENLPPPLHLMQPLILDDIAIDILVEEIRLKLKKTKRSYYQSRSKDAQRRFASAVAHTARNAVNIKKQKIEKKKILR